MLEANTEANNEFNRSYNSANPAQGDFKRVLCLCSAGLLRSPTAALVLADEPYNFNTRAAGLEESYALINADSVLVGWAQEIVCMTENHEQMLRIKYPDLTVPVKTLKIPDNFHYRDVVLKKMIKTAYDALSV